MASTNRLKTLREAKGLSSSELAVQIDSRYGSSRHVSEQTIRRWESEDGSIPQAQWSRLAEIFSVPVAHLLGLDDEQAA